MSPIPYNVVSDNEGVGNMRKRTEVTNEMLESMVSMYKQEMSVASIARALCLSPATVNKRLNIMGYDTSRFNTSNKFTDEAKELAVKLFNEGHSMQSIQKHVGVNHDTIARHLNVVGVDTLKNSRTYSYNERYFSVIDTEEKAYWLGFISADGCISESRKGGAVKSMKLEIALKKEDKMHLYRFCECIGASYELVKEKKSTLNGKEFTAYRVIVASTEMCRDLISHGITPRKTMDTVIPDTVLSSPLLKPFLRGLFDGDGHVSKEKCVVSITTASAALIEQLKVVGEGLGCTNLKVKYDKRSNGIDFRYNGKENMEKFLGYIYGDADIYLTRKYVRYIAHLSRSRSRDRVEEGENR